MELVECLASSDYPGRPLWLRWQGRRLEISDLLSEWNTPGIRHFRVRTTENRVFELTYFETEANWQIVPIPGG
jgi:hypothetical protein